MEDCPYLQHKDACGVGFVVDIKGRQSFWILEQSLHMLVHMNHRGGCQCETDEEIPNGDGAGVLTSIPHKLYRKELGEKGINTNELKKGSYATGLLFLDESESKNLMTLFENYAVECGCKVVAWRDVPTCREYIGKLAVQSEPVIKQVFITSIEALETFDKRVFLLRKICTHEIPKLGHRFYICSLSTQIIVYKGLFTSDQLKKYYLDLQNPDFETHIAICHSRYSTNTNPSWERAHPQRMLAHNGEINTIQGNVKNMRAREGNMKSTYFNDDTLKRLFPVIEAGQSDSGCVDNLLEFLVVNGGRNLPEAMLTLVPEAWQNDDLMSDYKKDFYKWSSCVIEAWDGPALFTFSDGRYIGALLDRNGLRPSRFYITDDGVMIMSSEVGVSAVLPEKVTAKGRLMPGKMLLVDTKVGSIIKDEELKYQLFTQKPFSEWISSNLQTLTDCYQTYIDTYGESPPIIPVERQSKEMGEISVETDRRMPLFGYSVEDINMLILPMIKTGKEALGSMGNDTPLACMTMHPQLVFDYFKQLFAQVTNPPIDPFREKIVMSLACPVGPEGNILSPCADQCKRLYLNTPIFSCSDLVVLTQSPKDQCKTQTIEIVYDVEQGEDGLEPALTRICEEAENAINTGCAFILLTDRKAGPDFVPISSLLAVGAVHQYLIGKKIRKKVGIIIEAGEVREIHHLCTLLGFGADIICPYLMFESFSKLRNTGLIDVSFDDEMIVENYKKAADIGIRKVMAKMGISTLHSYKGAQIFEAVGLGKEVMDKCFRGTASRLSGVNFKMLAQEALDRHRLAFSDRECDNVLMVSKGSYHWRDGGERHVNDPISLAHLQNATQNNNTKAYEKYVKSTMETIRACTIRGQLQLKETNNEVPLHEVESADKIVKRFCTGAMSFGSISEETHKTLAIAMNRIHGKSNSGEGGEEPSRYIIQDLNYNTRSSIKQIASGRFGVTTAYLTSADELQIKMAQGAKPGEGGELPGHKVTEKIAATRHSIPGIALISPPPHHDIYSIEDLSQLIYDLKCANPSARISVKLVSEVGVGVIASGVTKGLAEHIVISGHDGGTGASSWTGVKHAGLPWELGLSETHKTLIKNSLRQKVVLQVDGQLRTGYDVMCAALLGSDEYGFSTAPLISLGCTMMRKCHLNTCPVGIATQDPVLRKKFEGKPEYVINYFFMVAEEVRLLLSKLGFKSLQDVIGRTDLLETLSTANNEKTKLLEFNTILDDPGCFSTEKLIGGSQKQNYQLENRKDNWLIAECQNVIEGRSKNVSLTLKVENTDRTFATTLSHEVVKKHINGLAEGSIYLKLNGAGGQSFGAFLCAGITLELKGDANDYIGKGLSGGKIIIYPDVVKASYLPHENIIVGNVCLYGATSGQVFFSGVAAERFCVRNSGAVAVVEGCGDHGCEYMTGGLVVVLGNTGRNFAAGMSGGIAYVYDKNHSFIEKCNHDSVSILNVDSIDEETLKSLIMKHYNYTKSPRAYEILENWCHAVKYFHKILPQDYKKVLEKNKFNQVSEKKEERTPGQTSPPDSPPRKRDRTEVDILDIEDTIKNQDQESATVDRLLDKTRGFVKYSRSHNKYRSPTERVKDWNEIYQPMSKHALKVQTARCMDCGVPFCQSHTGCPLGNVIPKWNDLVFRGKWKDALYQLLQTNNFPEFTGRACPAPCESSCVLSINAEAVTIKSIECAIIDHGFQQGWMIPQVPAHRTGKKVAIIGSGPAGLAAAAQLNKAGHSVTIYERNDRCGGLLVYGIPNMKLDKKIVQRRIDLMQSEGIIFKTNAYVGQNIDPEELLEQNNAILLTIGSTWPRDLPIPGRHLKGVHFAMEFLETSQKHMLGKYNLPKLDVKDKDVIVIGGGDTGVDCIGTSVRMGAKSIITFELLNELPKKRSAYNPWPLLPRVFRMEYGHEEVCEKYGSDPRRYNIMCKEFIGNQDGHVTSVKTANIEWVKDVSGRWLIQEVANSEQTFKADMVLLALGFLGPEKTISKLLGVKHDIRSTIETTNKKFDTNTTNVYAAGDCRYGQSLIVTAIAEGRQAARQIDIDLMGNTSLAGPGGLIIPQRPPPKQAVV